MKSLRRCLSIVCLITLIVCTSCVKQKSTPYGTRIEEDLTTLNKVDDNYRNWYEIFVGSFYDSDGDGKGDIKGVTSKLDYIQDLGFTGIWLMPINSSPSYHKYDVKDYYQVDPSYGTMSDLEELISECHKRDIKIILDLVLNHSSLNHPWFNKAATAHQKYIMGLPLTSEEDTYKDFYSFYDGDNPPSGYQKVTGRSFYYEANFSSDMPEFNCDNPTVRQEFKSIIDFYMDKGVDGFRLDAVKYYYINSQTKNIELLNQISKWVKAKNPNGYVVGECWETSSTIIENYYTSGIDSFFNFEASVSTPSSYLTNCLNLEGKMLNRYYEGLLSNIKIAGNYIPAPFLDNHDMPRFTSSGNLSNSKFQFALLQMMNGATFTYYGDEVGLVGTNANAPDQNVRIPILWGEESEKGNCNAPSGTTKKEYPYPTVKEQMEDPNSIYHYYKKVMLIRNQNPEIARGEVSLLKQDRDNKILVIKKTYNGSEIGIVFNFSPTEDLTIDISEFEFDSVVGQIVITGEEEKYIGMLEGKTIKMPPYSIAILK